jgi:RNA polymerase sigma factor (sigma-70 family)
MAATRTLSTSLQSLARLLPSADLATMSDAELVGRFVQDRDEAAFTLLVRRYGGIVLGVCRSVLRHEQDAEDAFQATFLVLARDAARVRRTGAVGGWLHGVAHNVARKARTTRLRRGVKEREAAERMCRDKRDGDPHDLRELVDAELSALPDRYRTPIVLCDLRGLTTSQAASEVGCPAKTLGTRLARARTLLAARLTRRGVSLPAAALTTLLTAEAATAVPATLLDSSLRAAAGSAQVSPGIVHLTHGVSTIMPFKTLKVAALVACSSVVLVGLSAGPVRNVVGAAHGNRASASPGSPESGEHSQRAHSHNPFHVIHQFLYELVVGPADRADAAAPAEADDKDAPTLKGVWVKKEGELKIDFSAKGVMKLYPHGENEVIVIVFDYTCDKDGLVKAKVTGFEGKDEVKKIIAEKLPVGTAFEFQWKAKGDAASVGEVKDEKGKADLLKSHLEGEFEAKK